MSKHPISKPIVPKLQKEKRQRPVPCRWIAAIPSVVMAMLAVVTPAMASPAENQEVQETTQFTESGLSAAYKDGASGDIQQAESGVYQFPDTKTSGSITVVKKWDDQSNNAKRPTVDVSISTAKPSKNPLGYTITFHGDKDNGLVFADGKTTNDIVYNSSGQIVSGNYQTIRTDDAAVKWYTDKTYTTQIQIGADGTPSGTLNQDLEAWPKKVTVSIKGYDSHIEDNGFRGQTSDTVKHIIFTDTMIPEDAVAIDVDADGDDGVVAWTENNGSVMKVSTQIKGVKVMAAKNSQSMFKNKAQIQTIDFASLDTSNMEDARSMFQNCSSLTTVNVDALETGKVQTMQKMFQGCSCLAELDTSGWNTDQVLDMSDMFHDCSSLASINVEQWDTSQVTDMSRMFSSCGQVSNIAVENWNTENVTDMRGMFSACQSLTTVDVADWSVNKVTNMTELFCDCQELITLDVSNWKTGNVTSMKHMFENCGKLAALDVSKWNVSKVVNMQQMLYGCSTLTALDVSNWDTKAVTNMSYMLAKCSSISSLNVSGWNTQAATTMENMFYKCSALECLDVSRCKN